MATYFLLSSGIRKENTIDMKQVTLIMLAIFLITFSFIQGFDLSGGPEINTGTSHAHLTESWLHQCLSMLRTILNVAQNEISSFDFSVLQNNYFTLVFRELAGEGSVIVSTIFYTFESFSLGPVLQFYTIHYNDYAIDIQKDLSIIGLYWSST